jgi:hypothetical protein
MVSRTQIETEAQNRGRVAPPPAEAPGETLADLRVEMLQGALGEAQQARLDQAERLVDELRTRVAEKDARIAQLERQLAGYARSVADLLASDATTG